MLSNIIVGIMCVIVAVTGIWGWWMENGGLCSKGKKDGIEKDMKTDHEDTNRVGDSDRQ